MRTRQAGFTYIFLLFLVALGGILLVTASQTWWMNSKRDKEDELLFVGRQIRRAIESYYLASPADEIPSGSDRPIAGWDRYPRSLDDLLEDRRYHPPVRHLRRIFIDPVMGSKKWGLIREGERLIGVYSLSPSKPLRTHGFPSGEEDFAQATTYMSWRFVAKPDSLQTSARGTAQRGNLSGSDAIR